MPQRGRGPAVGALILGMVLATSCAAGCSDDDPPRDCLPTPLFLETGANGVRIRDSCGEIAGGLFPVILVDGRFEGGGPAMGCTVEGARLRCPAGDIGQVIAVLQGSEVRVDVEATRDATIQGVALVGVVRVPGANAWLSNGFQSWSQSGIVALGPPGTDADLQSALRERGDAEALRTGRELSWFHTWIGGGRAALFAGALTATRFKPWLRMSRDSPTLPDHVSIRLSAGGTGEAVFLPAGETLEGETWRFEGGTRLEEILTAYGDDVASRRRLVEAPAEAGWNSWYELWDAVDEDAVRANAALAAEVLGPILPAGTPLRITVDDGWQEAWGEWEPNEKFPSGLDGLAADLHADGFEVGVWLAPLLVTEDSSLVAEHPDWFVEDAFYNHSKNGRMSVLDPTHPGAASHLAGFIARLVGWGYDFLKIDFLFAGTFEGRRHEAITGMEAYHRALSIIREAAGEDVILLGVGAPGLASLPHVDAWRVGPDIAFEPLGPSWFFAVNQARTLASRWPLCRATLCDPDPPILRDLTLAEVGYGAWVVAFAGGGLFLSDDLRDLPLERRAWGLDGDRVQGSLAGLPAVPLDPFPASPPASLTSHALDHLAGENHHVLPERWRLADGRRVGLNHTEAPVTVEGATLPARGAGILP